MADGSVWEIDDGWDVLGVDGEKVGTISDIEPDYIVVSRGFLFSTERFIPVDAITNVEPGRVYLNVSRREIDQNGWTSPPVLTHATAVSGASSYDQTGVPQRHNDALLNAETIDRSLVDEAILVNRQPIADRDRDDMGQSFAHLELAVPIYGEVAVVRKRQVVFEMVEIARDFRERRQQFRDIVRREEVEIIRDDTSAGVFPDRLPVSDAQRTLGVR